MPKVLRIGSRDSKLALIQSHWVRERLLEKYPDLQIEIIEIKTQGDKVLDVALSKIGDKGLFTKELETELLAQTIDLAVHSMKDLPTQLPAGLDIVATSVREDVRDVVCLSEHALARGIKSIDEVKVVATSSLRRVAQLKCKYPHIHFTDMRGNLQTRFKKLDDSSNGFDCMILAAAGLHRLGLEPRISQYLDPQEILPAVGQGALGIEIASARDDLKELLRNALNSVEDEFAIKSERAFLRTLEGGCQVPIGAYAEIGVGSIKLTGLVSSLDGTQSIRESISGKLEEAEKLGYQLGYMFMKAGAGEILKGIRIG